MNSGAKPAYTSRDLNAYLNVGVSGSTVAQALAGQLPRVRSEPADLITVWLARWRSRAGVRKRPPIALAR